MKNKNSEFAKYLAEFLTIHLPYQRGYSQNTVHSYRDTFKQLLLFFETKNKRPNKITLEDFNKWNILEFLNWINKERNLSSSTINNRLSAIKSFLHYVVFAAPENLYNFQSIFEIPLKRKIHRVIPNLTVSQIKIILRMPNTNTKKGLRDLAILSSLYDSAARVQELIDLKVQDFCPGPNPYLFVKGKGGKSRKVPITKEVASLISLYKETFKLNSNDSGQFPLFSNIKNEKLSRSGITYILNKYVIEARNEDPSIPEHVHCHMMRHSKAFHLLEAGVSLPYIQDFLGHSEISTTQIYARSSLEMKTKAINKAYPSLIEDRPLDWTEKPELMAFLESL